VRKINCASSWLFTRICIELCALHVMCTASSKVLTVLGTSFGSYFHNNSGFRRIERFSSN
jgi:hypothetical protein